VENIEYLIYDLIFDFHLLNQTSSMNESLIGEFINDTLFDTLDLNVLVRRIVTTISFITEANSSSIEFALVGLSIYFKFSTTVNVIDDILN